MKAIQPAFLQLRKFKSVGKQPNGNRGDNGLVFNNVAKWYAKDRDPSIEPGFRWFRSSTIPVTSEQSIDHVYEKQLIELFLKSQIDTANFSCDDMITLFFPCGQNLMQGIFDELPGMQMTTVPNRPKNIKYGFAGLEKTINTAKGIMFDKGIDPPSSYWTNSLQKEGDIKTIQDFIMLFGIIKDGDFQRMFDMTNNRVYQAFSGVDNRITNRKDTNGSTLPDLQKADGTPMPANWASNYRTWMESHLDDIGGPVWTWANATYTTKERQLRSNTTLRSASEQADFEKLNYIKQHANFSQTYFKADFNLTWQTGNMGSSHDHQAPVHGFCASSAFSTSFGPTAYPVTASSFPLSNSLSIFSRSSTWTTVTTRAPSSTTISTASSTAPLSTSVVDPVPTSTISSHPTTLLTSSSNPTSMSTLSIDTTLVSTYDTDSAESTTIPDPTPSTTEPPVTTDPVDYFADPAIAMATTPAPEEDGPEVTPLPESIDAGLPF